MFAIPVGLSDTETSYFLTDFFNIAISSFAAFRFFSDCLALMGTCVFSATKAGKS